MSDISVIRIQMLFPDHLISSLKFNSIKFPLNHSNACICTKQGQRHLASPESLGIEPTSPIRRLVIILVRMVRKTKVGLNQEGVDGWTCG